MPLLRTMTLNMVTTRTQITHIWRRPNYLIDNYGRLIFAPPADLIRRLVPSDGARGLGVVAALFLQEVDMV